MDVLILKLAALGDVLRTTSVTRRLKACRPNARITWVTARAAVPLLEGNPDLERVHAMEDHPKLERSFDLVLSLEEDSSCARLARESCRGELIGVYEQGRLRYTGSSALYYDLSSLNRDPDGLLKTADRLKSENRLSYARLWLRILGLPEPEDPEELRPVLVLTAEERKAAARGLCLTGAAALRAGRGAKLSKAIGLNPGAGRRWPSKQLSPEPAARLADALGALGRPVVLLGGAEEKERNAEIARLAERPLVDAGTGRSLREFAGLVSRLDAVVTTDSLAFHVATALGRPTVVLVGPTSAAELDVFGSGNVLKSPDCSCFYRAECVRPPSCLDRLDPELVVRAVSRCLKG